MRLIDADKLRQNVLDWQDCYNGFSDTYDKAMIVEEIDAQPTIQAEPVKHGKWGEYLSEGLRWKCSLCKSRFVAPYTYCPHCGARMDKEEVEE